MGEARASRIVCSGFFKGGRGSGDLKIRVRSGNLASIMVSPKDTFSRIVGGIESSY
jgi:hypothetical protein